MHLTNALLQGLSEEGFVEGKNVNIEYRWANDQYERLSALSAELVRLRVNVTVKVHRGNAMRKMGARTLADLVRMAELLGIGQQKA